MLYVATVHYKSPRWIEIQASHLRRHLSVPYETWTSLEGIDSSYAASFDRVLAQRGRHAGKLNHLALEICHVAQDDDWIMFLDGDAFPIADPVPMLTEALQKAPLVAVRRAENLDDPQPHPCFCVTTVKTWRGLPGDWSHGAVWRNEGGEQVSDVGGNLLRTLELTNTPWVQLSRTNGCKLHPVFFAIYADVVYHHGAGFRAEESRIDFLKLKEEFAEHESAPNPGRGLRAAAMRIPLYRRMERRAMRKRREQLRARYWEHNREQSRRLFEAIEGDAADWVAQVKDAQEGEHLG